MKKDGELEPKLMKVDSESQFASPGQVPCLRYQLQDFQAVYQSKLYQELQTRKDETAREVVAQDDKLRNKSIFAKFI